MNQRNNVISDLRLSKLNFSPASLDEQGIVATPKDVVWDINDLSKQPPWKDNISGDITDLSDYFVTSGGEDFITLFFRALKKVEELGEPLKIETL